MNSAARFFAAIVLCTALTGAACRADAPTTAPAADDPPAPAALAPMYLSIGRDISLRLLLVRQTLDDLNLDPAIRSQAQQLIERPKRELDQALDQMQAGHMPSAKRVYSVPDILRTSRVALFALIGQQQAQLLEEKMSSLRGEARWRMGQLRNGLEDLKLSADRARRCDAILAAARPAAEKLPASQLDGQQYDRNRRQMNDLLAWVHDHLAAILSIDEQARLGQRFSDLADLQPTTRP
jgi:hypothetical protein